MTAETVALERLDSILDTPRKLLINISDVELQDIEAQAEQIRWRMIEDGKCDLCGHALSSTRR